MNTYTPNISRGLDFYKLTMGDLIYEKHPDAEVTFTLKNRNSSQPLSEYISPNALQERFREITQQGFTSEEIAYYAGLQAQDGQARFTEEYLDHLASMELPEVQIGIDPETNDLAISTIGPWTDVSLWETIVMSEVNELYYKGLMEQHGLELQDLYNEGDRRLDDKIARLQDRPDIQFSDFGTRRRFSADWHEHVIGRLKNELQKNFIGTSNPWFAYKYDLKPIGTFAHELPMVYCGLETEAGNDPLDGHGKMLSDWQEHYGNDLSTALTDTFGSDFFLSEFTKEQAQSWNGTRHDSGDPIEYGEKMIRFYEKNDIDPAQKMIVFSDGLNTDKIIEIANHFNGRIKMMFGWGTSLMNDLGLPANNFVMKATNVNGYDTVKLSDDAGKHTGPIEVVESYVQDRDKRLAHATTREMVTL